MSVPLMHLYFVWALTLLDLQYFLGAMISPAFLRLIHLAYPPLLIAMAFRAPILLATGKPWMVYPPFLLFFLAAIATTPFAANIQLAWLVFIYLLLYYTLAVATTVYVRTPQQAMPIVMMLALQFAWFAIFARLAGHVSWHPTLSNDDGFGAFSVVGLGICFWFGAAARNRWWKTFFFGLALYCVLSVVASYARGAFLSLIALLCWIWVRSPRKGVTAVAGIIALLAVLAGASLLFDPGFFWNEMASIFTEGKEAGTGGERWKLWMTAIEVFKARPILGTGGGNFGAFAAGYFRPGELASYPNPGVLYGFNLHNSYAQVLSEFGIVGTFAAIWLLVDFQKKNRLLRHQPAMQRWAAETGGRLNLRYIALALEAANIANLLGGIFYASLFMPWFWTIWAANRMLWAVTRGPPLGATTGPPRASSIRAGPASRDSSLVVVAPASRTRRR